MGKLKTEMLKFLTAEHFRVLTAVEMGMKNHEIVAVELVIAISNLKQGGCMKIIKDLIKHRLLAYEHRSRSNVEGYRLTFSGYDYLALKALVKRESIASFGSQIGVGKESDVYTVVDSAEKMYALKIHRLGRTSFRKLKEKRDYHKHRHSASWIYLSRLAAAKEFAFMKALHGRGFPVPQPIDSNRHCVLMELVDGFPLSQVRAVANPDILYDMLMQLIMRLAEHGVIHCDLNEFNLFVTEAEEPVLIDFPQMVSISHENAAMYFDRDVQGILDLFRKRFGFESGERPRLTDVIKEFDLDAEVEASGFTKEMSAFLSEHVDQNDADRLDSPDEASEDETHGDVMPVPETDIPVNHVSRDNVSEIADSKLTDSSLDDKEAFSEKREDHSGVDEKTDEKVIEHEDVSRFVWDRDDGMSVASTIAPDVIRNRVSQALKQRDKQVRKLRVKSQMAKITNNKRDIKSSIQAARDHADGF